jgi:hypothetical protein
MNIFSDEEEEDTLTLKSGYTEPEAPFGNAAKVSGASDLPAVEPTPKKPVLDETKPGEDVTSEKLNEALPLLSKVMSETPASLRNPPTRPEGVEVGFDDEVTQTPAEVESPTNLAPEPPDPFEAPRNSIRNMASSEDLFRKLDSAYQADKLDIDKRYQQAMSIPAVTPLSQKLRQQALSEVDMMYKTLDDNKAARLNEIGGKLYPTGDSYAIGIYNNLLANGDDPIKASRITTTHTALQSAVLKAAALTGTKPSVVESKLFETELIQKDQDGIYRTKPGLSPEDTMSLLDSITAQVGGTRSASTGSGSGRGRTQSGANALPNEIADIVGGTTGQIEKINSAIKTLQEEGADPIQIRQLEDEKRAIIARNIGTVSEDKQMEAVKSTLTKNPIITLEDYRKSESLNNHVYAIGEDGVRAPKGTPIGDKVLISKDGNVMTVDLGKVDPLYELPDGKVTTQKTEGAKVIQPAEAYARYYDKINSEGFFGKFGEGFSKTLNVFGDRKEELPPDLNKWAKTTKQIVDVGIERLKTRSKVKLTEDEWE